MTESQEDTIEDQETPISIENLETDNKRYLIEIKNLNIRITGFEYTIKAIMDLNKKLTADLEVRIEDLISELKGINVYVRELENRNKVLNRVL